MDDNNNNTHGNNEKKEETLKLTLKRHEAYFLDKALKKQQRITRYCLARVADIDFIEDKLMEDRLGEEEEKEYYNLDLYIQKISVDLDKFLYPFYH